VRRPRSAIDGGYCGRSEIVIVERSEASLEVLSPSARLVLLHDAMRGPHKKPALLCQNPKDSCNFFPQAGQAPQAKLPAYRHPARNEI
jgi:hypothetical protein